MELTSDFGSLEDKHKQLTRQKAKLESQLQETEDAYHKEQEVRSLLALVVNYRIIFLYYDICNSFEQIWRKVSESLKLI